MMISCGIVNRKRIIIYLPEMNKWWNINDDAAKNDDFVDSTLCSLIDYGVYGGSQFQSVIYNSWLNAEHCPTENESPTLLAIDWPRRHMR